MRLFWYIIKDFFKYVFGSIVLCVFLFVLFDFIHKTTKYFARYKPPTQLIIRSYLYEIPNLLGQALPIAALLSSVVCMVLLSRTNEITAMRAAGMGPLRVGLPVAAGGFILSLLSLFLGEVVVPKTSERSHYVNEILIEGASVSQLTEGARWVRDNDRLINFEDFDPVSFTLSGVRIIDTGPNFRPKQSLHARRAGFVKELGAWRLEEIKVLTFHPNGTLAQTEVRKEQVVLLPIDPTKLKRDRRKPSERSLGELWELIRRGEQSGADVSAYKVDMHVKFAFHFAAFIVSLIGLKFGYRSERSLETARGVLLAFAIGISYWFILNAGRALGSRAILPPLIGAWMANVIIGAIAYYEIWRVRKSN